MILQDPAKYLNSAVLATWQRGEIAFLTQWVVRRQESRTMMSNLRKHAAHDIEPEQESHEIRCSNMSSGIFPAQ